MSPLQIFVILLSTVVSTQNSDANESKHKPDWFKNNYLWQRTTYLSNSLKYKFNKKLWSQCSIKEFVAFMLWFFLTAIGVQIFREALRGKRQKYRMERLWRKQRGRVDVCTWSRYKLSRSWARRRWPLCKTLRRWWREGNSWQLVHTMRLVQPYLTLR